MRYVALEKLMYLVDGYRQVFRVGDKELLLIQENGQRYIVDAHCPHSDWPMQNAFVFADEITCSKHGWTFSLRSGKGVNEKALGCQLPCYKVVYEGNTLGVML